jgi:hypothetical protein
MGTTPFALGSASVQEVQERGAIHYALSECHFTAFRR